MSTVLHEETITHPLPSGLDDLDLPLSEASGPAWRVHRRVRDPLHFGRAALNRWDAPEGGAYGVLYAAEDLEGAFIESLGHGHVGGTRLVTGAELRERSFTKLHFDRPLRLVDLTAEGLVRLGADLRLCAGDYQVAQAWSAAFEAHPDRPDGVRYRSRHDPTRCCVAIFERARPVVRAAPEGTLFSPALRGHLVELLEHYDFGLVD